MSWLKLKLEADRDRVAHLTQALEDCGALAVTLEDAGSHTPFGAELNTATLWPRNRITGLFPGHADVSAIVQQIEEKTGASLTYNVEALPDRDWQAIWRKRFRPMYFGGNLWVCPTWCTPPQPNAVNVFIDPGLAFGSGTHPSTQLCLEWLAR